MCYHLHADNYNSAYQFRDRSNLFYWYVTALAWFLNAQKGQVYNSLLDIVNVV